MNNHKNSMSACLIRVSLVRLSVISYFQHLQWTPSIYVVSPLKLPNYTIFTFIISVNSLIWSLHHFVILDQASELLSLNWYVTGGSNSNKGKMDQTWSILILTYPQIADEELPISQVSSNDLWCACVPTCTILKLITKHAMNSQRSHKLFNHYYEHPKSIYQL